MVIVKLEELNKFNYFEILHNFCFDNYENV